MESKDKEAFIFRVAITIYDMTLAGNQEAAWSTFKRVKKVLYDAAIVL